MLTLQGLTSLVALLVAAGAFLRARRLARRLERLSDSYWELRYEYGQLRARLAQIEEPGGKGDAQETARQLGATAFVPLSSLRR